MTKAKLLKSILVKIKLNGKGYGSGVLWRMAAQYFIITCRHNFCHSNQDCEITCGNSCENLGVLTEVKVMADWSIHAQKMYCSDQADLAILLCDVEDNKALDEVFEGILMEWPKGPLLEDAYVFFAGYPADTSTKFQIQEKHFFDGFVSDPSLDNLSFEISERSSVALAEVGGVSGCGVFGENKNGQLVLLGIITDFKRRNIYQCVGGLYTKIKDLVPELTAIVEREQTLKKFYGEQRSRKYIAYVNVTKKILKDTDTRLIELYQTLEILDDKRAVDEQIKEKEKLYLRQLKNLDLAFKYTKDGYTKDGREI